MKFPKKLFDLPWINAEFWITARRDRTNKYHFWGGFGLVILGALFDLSLGNWVSFTTTLVFELADGTTNEKCIKSSCAQGADLLDFGAGVLGLIAANILLAVIRAIVGTL